MTGIGDLQLAQEDGGLPTTLVAGAAPGESGVSILSVRVRGSAHLSGTLGQHFICFQLSPRIRFECRIAGRTVRHAPSAGSLAICPAGIDWVADGDASVDGLLVAIEPGGLADAAAEEAGLRRRVLERVAGRGPGGLREPATPALQGAASHPHAPG